MLTALLGTAYIQDELAALVLDKTDGVPFFLEELVKALQETGAIEQHDGQWRLTAQATGMPVPDSVEEVLMARIDRLSEGAKSVLQMGAVIGRELSGELLREIAGLPEWELTTHLAALTEGRAPLCAWAAAADNIPLQACLDAGGGLPQSADRAASGLASPRCGDARDPLSRPLGGVLRATGAPLL